MIIHAPPCSARRSGNHQYQSHALSHTDITRQALTCAGSFFHVCSRAKRWHVRSVPWCHLLDPILPGPTWKSDPVRTTCTKKKKKKKAKALTKFEHWLGPKSKNGPVSLGFLSTFRFYDPFLHLRLGNCTNGLISKRLTIAWILTKSQNFQNGPVPLSFSHKFWFWNPFLCSRLGNCANCPISRKLTFAQILTKSQNFQGPVLPNFSRRFQFWGLFLHSRI